MEHALVGKWKGGTKDMPATVSGGSTFLRYAQAAGPADHIFEFSGNEQDVWLSGDWDGDGDDEIGFYRCPTFHLRHNTLPTSNNSAITFGQCGDIPVVGDWNGDGIDTIGVLRGNTWYLRNTNLAGAADITFSFGSPGDKPIVGDWDGNGTDTIGVVRGSTVYLRNANSAGISHHTFSHGGSADKFLAGDWNGDGVDTLGIVQQDNDWHLRNSHTSGAGDIVFNFDL